MSRRRATDTGCADEVYFLTLQGLISTEVDNAVAAKVVNAIELYLRRHHAKTGHPAIVLDLDDGVFRFVTLEKEGAA